MSHRTPRRFRTGFWALAALATPLALAACGAAEEGADGDPSFREFAPPSGAAGSGAASPGDPNAPGPGGNQTGSAAAGGSGPAPGNSTEGNGGSLGLAAGGSASTNTGSAGSASTGGSGAGSGAAGASMQGAGGTGVAGPAIGRVGSELCPPGPFGDPIEGEPTVQRLFTLDANDFFNFEGPVWDGDALYFSEVASGNNPPPSRINRYVPGGTTFERGFLEDTGSNGLGLDADGNLIAATHDVGAISTFQLPGGTRGQLGAQTFNGQRFNSPNDLVLRGDGNLYFTDPSFQAPGNPQGATRVYRISPAGVASVVDDSLGNPNGITLSPDGSTLYVTAAGRLRRYDLAADGTPGAGSDIQLEEGLSEPDGMTIDCAGNIYTTEHAMRRIRVFDPDGNQLESFGGSGTFPNNVTNLAFGGPNRSTLFITTLTQNGGGVFAVETSIPGFPY